MKKTKKLIAALAAILMATSCFTACGGSTGVKSEDKIEFWFYGSDAEVKMYKAMTDAFNETYGKAHGYEVSPTSKPIDAYWTNVRASASTRSGPDVFLEIDDNFKKNIGNGLTGILDTELNAITDIDVSDIWGATANRYRYDTSDNSSDPSDPLYGYVVDSRPTALYYNETLFEGAGITVISVAEEDLPAWNEGKIADARGKTKADYGIDVNVPARGYYRSLEQYEQGGEWVAPISGETLVFNNQIAMNWDEIEDLAMIFSDSTNKSYSDSVKCDYGFFTEWWFMYGWGVGGDCLTDLNGEYNFSLLDGLKNYVVAEGKSFTGVSGKTYTAGQSLSIADKVGIAENSITANNDGTYSSNGTKVAVCNDVKTAASEGVLTELPSTKEAFERYLRLGVTQNINGKAGLNISPKPNQFTNGKSAVNYFISGQLAILNTYSSYMSEISKAMQYANCKWDVAPTIVYKEYNSKDEVIKQGVTASQSNTFGLVSRKASKKKEAAAAFIKWMASKEAQELKASYGFFPNQESLKSKLSFSEGEAPKNVDVFFDSIKWQNYGDWRYLSDYVWVDLWAVDLNEKVRNDSMNYADWISAVVNRTNDQLKKY